MRHIVTVRVEVDGVPIHRAFIPLEAEGLIVEALGEFDPRASAVAALRMEADVIEEEGRRLARHRELDGEWVIDAEDL